MQHIPYVTHVTDDVVLLRDGCLMAAFVLDGLPAQTCGQEEVDDLAGGFAAAVTQSQPDLAVYVHRFSTTASPGLQPVTGQGFAGAIDAAWQSHMQQSRLRHRQIMVSIVLRPSKIVGLWSGILGGGKNQQRTDLSKRIDRLN